MKTPLTPLRFLERAGAVHPDRTAIVDGSRSFTYMEMATEVNRLAQALKAGGLGPGDRVAYLAPNSAELLMAHFAVPLSGGVLVTLNTRLAPAEIVRILEHSGAEILIGDAPLLEPALQGLSTVRSLRRLVTVPAESGDPVHCPGAVVYDKLLAEGSDEPLAFTVPDEDNPICVNYTSGTTGDPKGVVYTHRGAYLNSLGVVIHQTLSDGSVYLWTLPMFHCNGWCTTWALTAVAGRHVCLREVRADQMWSLIDEAAITHMAGAPRVLSLLREAPQAQPVQRPLTFTVGGSPPGTIGDDLNIRVLHAYGLTETYGPYTVCEQQESWAALPDEERAALTARQGVGMVTAEDVRVVATQGDPEHLVDVPADGVTIGEIVMRGNTVMAEYFRDPDATAKAFRGGWFHSGDLGVRHPDGYIAVVDRAKDIIVSGGENISSIEVEAALKSHPAVTDAAVIGVPDEIWGERPKAFVVLAAGRLVNQADLITHVTERLAKFKAPDSIEFVTELPSTPTGKIRKQQLRDVEHAHGLSKAENERARSDGHGGDGVRVKARQVFAGSPLNPLERNDER